MKRWIAALFVGLAGAGSTWGQSPAFHQVAPSYLGDGGPLPSMPAPPSTSDLQLRSARSFPLRA